MNPIDHLRSGDVRERQPVPAQFEGHETANVSGKATHRLSVAALLLTIICVAAAVAAQCAPVYRRASWLSQIMAMPRRAGVVESPGGPMLQRVSLAGMPSDFLGVEYGPAKHSPLDLFLEAKAACILCREPRTVHLSYTEFGDNDLSLLLPVATLENLRLNGTNLTDAAVARLSKLPRLRSLSLNQTTIGDAGVEALRHCPKLNLIRLRGTRVTDRALYSLQKMPTLEGLDLSDTAVTVEGLKQLRSLHRLESLELAGLCFGDDDVELLASHPCLNYLDLSRTPLTDRGLLALTRSASFCRLRVEQTQVTAAGLREFLRLRSGVELIHSVQYPPISR